MGALDWKQPLAKLTACAHLSARAGAGDLRLGVPAPRKKFSPDTREVFSILAQTVNTLVPPKAFGNSTPSTKVSGQHENMFGNAIAYAAIWGRHTQVALVRPGHPVMQAATDETNCMCSPVSPRRGDLRLGAQIKTRD